jgi:hypothetical protein
MEAAHHDGRDVYARYSIGYFERSRELLDLAIKGF